MTKVEIVEMGWTPREPITQLGREWDFYMFTNEGQYLLRIKHAGYTEQGHMFVGIKKGNEREIDGGWDYGIPLFYGRIEKAQDLKDAMILTGIIDK